MKRVKGTIRSIVQASGYDIHKRHDLEASVGSLLSAPDVKTIVDVGANVGNSVKLWRELFSNSDIFCFEPVETNYKVLQARFANDSKVKVIPKALGDSNSRDNINLSSGGGTHSFLSRSDHVKYGPPSRELDETVAVEMERLDDWIDQNINRHVDLLKIDVEGFEKSVFSGARETLQKQRVSVIVLEVMFTEIFLGQALYFELAGELSEKGYTLFDIPYIRRHPNGQARWGDAVFVSDTFRKAIL